jgi:hypothetical protein
MTMNRVFVRPETPGLGFMAEARLIEAEFEERPDWAIRLDIPFGEDMETAKKCFEMFKRGHLSDDDNS